ncbi:hypothetical protein [Bartonella sp. CL70QHWL]
MAHIPPYFPLMKKQAGTIIIFASPQCCDRPYEQALQQNGWGN